MKTYMETDLVGRKDRRLQTAIIIRKILIVNTEVEVNRAGETSIDRDRIDSEVDRRFIEIVLINKITLRYIMFYCYFCYTVSE